VTHCFLDTAIYSIGLYGFFSFTFLIVRLVRNWDKMSRDKIELPKKLFDVKTKKGESDNGS